MSHPDRILVQAVIPHKNDPERHIVDSEGNYPSRVHEAQAGTYEGTLRAIGRDVIGRILSVQVRRIDLEADSQTITYQTKPIDHPFDPESDYRWMNQGQ